MSQSNGPNGAQGHLEWELSIVGNLPANNPSLTSLKSQWQSWDRLQLLEKSGEGFLKICPKVRSLLHS